MPSIKDHAAAPSIRHVVNAHTDCVRCRMEGSAGDVGATGPQAGGTPTQGKASGARQGWRNRRSTPGLLAPCYRTVKCSQELFHFNHRISFLG